MHLTQLALIFVAIQLFIVAAVSYALTTKTRRPKLIRGLGIFLFICLESALILQIFESSLGHLVDARDILAYTALAASIALAFGSGDNLLGLLHRTRRDLSRSENLSQTLFERSSEPIIMLNPVGDILESNATACTLLSYTREKLRASNISAFTEADDMTALQDRMTGLGIGESVRVAMRFRNINGSRIYAECVARGLENGTFLLTINDVTEQTRSRVNLERFARISSETGHTFFQSVVKGLADSLELEHVLVGQLVEGRTDRVKTLALLIDGKIIENLEYDLAGAPCNTVVGHTMKCYPSKVQELFPEDTMLVDIGAVSYVGTPLVGSDGSPLGLICALSRRPMEDAEYCQTVLACYSHRVESEIERLRAEEALRESEERYSNIVNVSPFGMHMYHLQSDGRLVFEAANAAADWLLGLDHSKLIGKTIEDAFPSLAHTEVPEQYRKVAEQGERWRTESVSYKDNHISGAFEVIAFQRSPNRMAAVFMSITERKQSEEALRESEAGLASAQKIARIGNWSLELQAGKLYLSAEMYRICGLNSKEKPNTEDFLTRIVHPDDRERVQAAISALIMGRKQAPIDYRIVYPDGSVHFCQTISAIDFSSTGKPVRILGTTQDITERKLADEELHSVTERLALATQSAGIGIWDRDLSTNALIWDDGMYHLYGVNAEQFDGAYSAWRSCVHPDELSSAEAEVNKALSGEKEYDTEFRVIRPDGSVRYIKANGTVQRDESGKPLRMLGTNSDITARKQAELSLKESKDRYSRLYHETPCMLHSIDAEGRLISVSEMWLAKMGYTRDEVIGRKSSDFLTAESAEYARAVILPEYFKTGVCRDVLYDFVRKDGTIMKVRLSATSERDAEGKIIRSMAALEDVTELDRDHRELQQSLSLLRATLESTADGILVVDAEGKVAGFNQRFLEHWRIPVTLAEQKDDASLIAFVLDQLRDPNGFVQKVKELYAQPSAESFDMLVFKDGRVFERYSQPQRMGDEIIGRVWSFRDVTERKRAETERLQLEEQLRLSQKLETIGTLAAGIAHDFNNLLVPVIGYTELADSDLDPENPSHDHLAEVLKAAYRAKSLVGQILAFSRQQSGENKLIRIESVVGETVHLLKSTLPPEIILKTVIAPDLPQLFADATQLHQILMNLCVNASHAMRQGGSLIISVSATSGETAHCCICGCQMFGKHIDLSVADTGHGMDQITQRRIFDPFFTTKPVGEGTGLGLAVTHGIVAHHGGHICVSSKVGEGTTFHVYLPAVEGEIVGRPLTNTEKILISAPIPVS